jgi:hypothetical protein
MRINPNDNAVEKVKRSQIDPSKIITDDDWAISLVRQPDTAWNLLNHLESPEFLVLEGKKGDKSIIYFADFVEDDNPRMDEPGALSSRTKGGEIRKWQKSAKEAVDSPDELLYSCTVAMMKIDKGSCLLYSTWSISEHRAQKLITNLEEKKKNPAPFDTLGDSHNRSFAFAKKILHDLNDENIQVPGDRSEEWIVSASSRHRVDRDKPRWGASEYLFIAALSFSGGFLLSREDEKIETISYNL